MEVDSVLFKPFCMDRLPQNVPAYMNSLLSQESLILLVYLNCEDRGLLGTQL